MELADWLSRGVAAVRDWEDSFGAFDRHPSLRVDPEGLAAAFDELTGRLRGNYPYFHPFYAGQMLKPPHPAAVAGYLTAMLINPNNHALDGGPATSELEKEVMAQLAAMFGLAEHLGHLTSSGTIANLEALWVARELHPGRGIAYSAEAHYTHGRMCGVLGVPGVRVAVDGRGRMDVEALADLLAGGQIGTVVATTGTTGLGAIDPVHEVLAVARKHGVRVHVDAAYGGFFTLLAGRGDRAGLDPAPWRAIASCDSVVVDPHKHGLQPYGCGAVLFGDPSVGRLYRHDSPYTYFTSDELHLGEISLECSRAGAAAAALWLTLQLLPLRPGIPSSAPDAIATPAISVPYGAPDTPGTPDTPDTPAADGGGPGGLGEVLAAGRRAALDWSALLAASDRIELYQPPELDIVCYFPAAAPRGLAAIDAASGRMLADGGADPDRPVYLSTLTVTAEAFGRRHADVAADRDQARILRSVLMKPESETYLAELHSRVENLAGR